MEILDAVHCDDGLESDLDAGKDLRLVLQILTAEAGDAENRRRYSRCEHIARAALELTQWSGWNVASASACHQTANTRLVSPATSAAARAIARRSRRWRRRGVLPRPDRCPAPVAASRRRDRAWS